MFWPLAPLHTTPPWLPSIIWCITESRPISEKKPVESQTFYIELEKLLLSIDRLSNFLLLLQDLDLPKNQTQMKASIGGDLYVRTIRQIGYTDPLEPYKKSLWWGRAPPPKSPVLWDARNSHILRMNTEAFNGAPFRSSKSFKHQTNGEVGGIY